MDSRLVLDKLGETLVKYIKEKSPYTLAEVARSTLGITYSNFQKRLSKNNIKLHELQKILNFLQLEITVSVGDMTFQSASVDTKDYEKIIAEKDKVLQLQDKVIQLQEELHEYRKKEMTDILDS